MAIACLGISAVLRLALLMSDSETYRAWVYLQIGLHFVGMRLFFYAARFKKAALFSLFALSTVFIFINAKYLNYGHIQENVMAFAIFWSIYGCLAWLTRWLLAMEKKLLKPCAHLTSRSSSLRAFGPARDVRFAVAPYVRRCSILQSFSGRAEFG